MGLIVWQADNNFFRSTLTHSLSGGNIYVEQSKDNPSDRPRARAQTGGGNVTIAAEQDRADHDQDALHAHQRRQHASTAQYQVIAPATDGERRLGQLPGHGRAGPARRPAAEPDGRRRAVTRRARGSASSPRATSPARRATTRTPATPADVKVDYFRVTPDNCPTGADQTAPTTTATAAPAAPNGTAGWYTSDVNVTLAGNDGANGSGIDKHRVQGRRRRVRHLHRPGRAHDDRHAHGRVPLDRQERQRRGHQDADRQGRQGGPGRPPATLEPATTRRNGPGDAHARRDRPGLRASPRASTRSATASPFGALRRAVADVGAGVGGPTTRPPSRSFTAPGAYSVEYRSTRRRPATSRPSSRSRSRSPPRTTITLAPVTTRDARPELAPGAGPARTRDPGHGEVLGDRSGSGRRHAARPSRSTPPGDRWAAGDRRASSTGDTDPVELPGRRSTSRTTCGWSSPGGNHAPAARTASR